MPDRHPLQEIKSFPSLVKYLRDELEWPIESDDFDDLTFDYEPEDLGLDAKTAAKIESIKQLRPLTTNQPWGIFFVKFEPLRLPVVALRKILGNLVIKKRATVKGAGQATWKLHDLLFISAFGDGDDRQITLAHFSDTANGRDLPTLKVLGWDELDTQLNLRSVDRTLHDKLRWPADDSNVDAWRDQWSSAFTLRHRHVITTAEQLAERLAELAKAIRAQVAQVLEVESARGPLRKLYAAFQQALIHDLTEADFADMYAQTITYGLFSAAVSRTTADSGTFVVADNLADMVPITNPFLKEMLGTFLAVGGRKGKLDFDELGIQNVITLLNSTDTDLVAVVRNFGDRRKGEDPVIHFYEDFLKQYDKKRKVERGVFYTPQPVVSYIVRSVHELLQTEFGLTDGLADVTTWGELIARRPELKLPTVPVWHEAKRQNVERPIDPATPFVQILDPATGTATFLVEVIDLIHKTMTAKWTAQGLNKEKQRAAWNDYVPKHLLPRLHGYELMMAPYAIAHMKLGLKLTETGYWFRSAERARIYLTNALEPAASDVQQQQIAELSIALAHEAKAVNDVKRNQRFTVVIGNPPYSGVSSNMSEYAQKLVDPYKIVDGKPLNERKLWLQDDYVKFIRAAQMIIDRTGVGVLGYITNHSYLDNPTFRGMRQSLMGSLGLIRVMDLHGNTTRHEKSPDQIDDENVFDIKQGVAILLANRQADRSDVHRYDFWGSREAKYSWLNQYCCSNTEFSRLNPDSPYYFFEPQDITHRAEYDNGWKLNDAMPFNCAGFITARDHFAVDLDRDRLLDRIAEFGNLRKTDATIRSAYFAGSGSAKYPNGDSRGWKVPDARRRVAADKKWKDRIRECAYRPFDSRYIYWADWIIDWPRPEASGHMLAGQNVAIHVCRQSISEQWAHALAARGLIDDCYVSNKSRERGYMHPLYLYGEATGRLLEGQRVPNMAPKFLEQLGSALGIPIDADSGMPKGVKPEDVFGYFYAVLHNPTYRTRYAEFLKIDFPRIQLPRTIEVLRELSTLGNDLISLHLLESARVEKTFSKFVAKQCEVEKVSWSNDVVWIDKAQTCGFRGVPEEVWNFHIGGYQVCEKWLKDRKGRTLSDEDVAHYQKIVVALSETIRLMKEIDEVIDKHGGWPGAFAVASPPLDGAAAGPGQAKLPFA